MTNTDVLGEALVEEEVNWQRPFDSSAEYRAYVKWNQAQGHRVYGTTTLPWSTSNLRNIRDDFRYMMDRYRAVGLDLEKFRRESEFHNPWTLPEDDSQPIKVNDPRARHLWVQAAEVAREKGYCGTYDTVAVNVGVPSRADLRESGELLPKMRLTFRGPMINLVVDNPTNSGNYESMARNVPPEQLRQLILDQLNSMDDDELRRQFPIHDYRQME